MIIVGEKINATRPQVRSIIQDRDERGLVELAMAQSEAGADYVDVNVGTGIGSRSDEVAAMQWAVETIQKQVDTPLCIDSSDPEVLEAGLQVRAGRPSLINSAQGEQESLQRVVPLAGKYGTLLVALAMDGAGIPKTAEERVAACKEIAGACDRNGIALDRVFFDPLVLPVSTDTGQGKVTLDTLAAVKELFPEAKTILGLSNISYGLPSRVTLNTAFLHMAAYTGLDAAIADPTDDALMLAARAAEALVGKDRHCRRYTRALRNMGS